MNPSRAASVLASAVLALVGIAAAMAVGAPPASADQAVAVQECDGVTVVVDFTDLGGAVESGCAEGDPGSGREALESAGFTPVDSQPGLICTIDGQPDPCPTEFEGSYWAYWQVLDGEWTASQAGAGDTDPAPGDIEGWRYNDGSVPPPLPQTGESAEQTSSAAATEASTAATAEDEGGGVPVGIWAVIGVVVVGLVVGLVVRRQRATGS